MPQCDLAGIALLQRLAALADHGLDQRRLVDRGRRCLRDLAAVAEHRHRVGDAQYVLDEMRDEDDRGALFAQPSQGREQPLHLRRRQRRGRLVEDDDAGAREQHAGDLDQLLQADRQIADPRQRIDVDAEPRELLAGLRAMRRHCTSPKRLVGCVPRNTFSATDRSGATLSS